MAWATFFTEFFWLHELLDFILCMIHFPKHAKPRLHQRQAIPPKLLKKLSQASTRDYFAPLQKDVSNTHHLKFWKSTSPILISRQICTDNIPSHWDKVLAFRSHDTRDTITAVQNQNSIRIHKSQPQWITAFLFTFNRQQNVSLVSLTKFTFQRVRDHFEPAQSLRSVQVRALHFPSSFPVVHRRTPRADRRFSRERV